MYRLVSKSICLAIDLLRVNIQSVLKRCKIKIENKQRGVPPAAYPVHGVCCLGGGGGYLLSWSLLGNPLPFPGKDLGPKARGYPLPVLTDTHLWKQYLPVVLRTLAVMKCVVGFSVVNQLWLITPINLCFASLQAIYAKQFPNPFHEVFCETCLLPFCLFAVWHISPQLQGYRRDIWSLLEPQRGQSWCKRIGWFGKSSPYCPR